MICVIKMVENEIAGWIIARDLDDAHRRANDADEPALAVQLLTVDPQSGMTRLPGGYVVLVEEDEETG